ncbi:hypothetical protein [Pseudomonas sp. ACN5]|uniref:hypothetical protein n=1 Tax=Pseudomonas sp. ACN5 TaxID=1920427 RepID=UPI000BB2F8D3|nr:hypothetical protein [Pseudomonas sp. ACN5]PBJ08464.1 hypothetical protein BSF40_13340 [Pseudomonas sp. ACN5]
MSLLSGLLDNMPPTIAPERLARPAQPAPVLVLVRRVEHAPVTSPYMNAANATSEWRFARDQYLNHVMTCRACCAPKARYCLAGADLRATYDRTPMESS